MCYDCGAWAVPVNEGPRKAEPAPESRQANSATPAPAKPQPSPAPPQTSARPKVVSGEATPKHSIWDIWGWLFRAWGNDPITHEGESTGCMAERIVPL